MKKNIAGQKVGAQLVNATTGAAFTGAVTVSVTVDAGTQATGSVGSGACTHEGNGYHTYAPAQAETDGDLVAFTFTGSGAVPVTLQVYPITVSSGGRPSVSTDEMFAGVIDSNSLNTTAIAQIAKRVGVQHTGTCQSGSTSTTIVLAAGASSVDSFYVGQTVGLREYTGGGQSRLITAYVGSTRTATVDSAWITTPDNTTDYAILPQRQYTVAETQSGLATSAALSTAQADLTTLVGRLTSARAGYLDNLSAGAVAQASNLATVAGYIDTEVAAIQTDITTLLTRLSSLRAGYLDNLSGGAVALQASVTSVSSNLTIVENKIDTIDNFVDTEVAAIAADVTTLIGRLTALRAGYLDNLSAGAVAQASAVATLAGYVDTEVAAILAAVDTEVADIQSRLPAALVGGRIDASVGAMAAGVVTAAAVATGAIDADALATDAVTEIQTGLATSAALATAQADLTRLLGLHNENARIDNTTYASGKCTAMRIRVFASAAAANASTSGAADNADSEVARYTVAASYTGDELDTYKMVRAL